MYIFDVRLSKNGASCVLKLFNLLNLEGMEGIIGRFGDSEMKES